MKTLALDTSIRNTGWAFHQTGCSIETGCVSFQLGTQAQVKKMGLAEEQVKGEQALRFLKWIRKMITDYKPDEICIEKSFLNLNPSTEIIVGIQIAVLFAARHYDIPVYRYATTSLKAFALAPGYLNRYEDLKPAQRSKAIKAEMVEAAMQELKAPSPITDDEADAFHCLKLHLSTRK